MFTRQAIVIATLSLILAACSAGAEPTASPQASPSPSQRPPSLRRVSPTPTTTIATPIPTAAPGPTAKVTPHPVPPKPTGVQVPRERRLPQRVVSSIHAHPDGGLEGAADRGCRDPGLRRDGYASPRRPTPKPGSERGHASSRRRACPRRSARCSPRHQHRPAQGNLEPIDNGDLAGATYGGPSPGPPAGRSSTTPSSSLPIASTAPTRSFAIAATGTWVEPDWESGDLYC